MRFDTRILVTACCVIASSAAPNVGVAQASSLTAMDYIEIQQLVAKFSFALDYGTNRG
jgi:hypothetical protein